MQVIKQGGGFIIIWGHISLSGVKIDEILNSEKYHHIMFHHVIKALPKEKTEYILYFPCILDCLDIFIKTKSKLPSII